jgi:hypothetical protein
MLNAQTGTTPGGNDTPFQRISRLSTISSFLLAESLISTEYWRKKMKHHRHDFVSLMDSVKSITLDNCLEILPKCKKASQLHVYKPSRFEMSQE